MQRNIYFSYETASNKIFKDVVILDDNFLYIFWQDADYVDKFLIKDDTVYSLLYNGDIYGTVEIEIQELYQFLKGIPDILQTEKNDKVITIPDSPYKLELVENPEVLLTHENPKLREFVKELI